MSLIITLIYQETIYHTFLEENGKATIGCGKKDDIQIDSLKNEQFTVKWNKNGVFLSGKPPFQKLKLELALGELIQLDSDLELLLTEATGTSDQKMKLPYNCVIKVGRNEEKNQIVLRQRYVSREHMVIRSEEGIVRIEDIHSLNGVYVNQKLIEKNKPKKIQPGDEISILDIQIILENGQLSFQNAGEGLVLKKIEHDLEAHEVKRGNSLKAPRFQRSPRMQEQLPTEPVTLAAPPMKGGRFERRKGIFTSLFGQGAMMAANMAMGAASPAFMLARAAGMIAPMANVKNQIGGDRRQKKKMEEYERMRELRYGSYIREQQALIEAVAKDQRDILTRENPSPEECLGIVRNVNRNLWERDFRDRDFLDVRLGMSYETLCVPVKSFSQAKGFQMENDDVRSMAEELIERTRVVDYVPGRLQLKKYNTVGMIGERKKVISEIRNLLISLCTLHFYRDVKIVGIFDEEERNEWISLRWLPHVWDDDHQTRFLAFNRVDAHQLCEKMNDLLESRKRKLAGKDKERTDWQYPHYLFILGSRSYLKKETLMDNLVLNPPEMGISSIFLFDDVYNTPSACEYFVDLKQEPSTYERDKINHRTYFTMDETVGLSDFDAFTRNMSAIELEGFAEKAEIPDSITFLQGYGVQKVEELDAEKRWRESKPYQNLAAPIGVKTGNKTLFLDVFDFSKNPEAHGPHGLVAGTTGAGKSELLQSWLLSLALNFHPHEVTFVAIDYKGGGMANLFDNLPHMVGKITNIGGNIKRSLESLRYEITRRSMIFEKCSKACGMPVNHIIDYLKLYREKRITEPLPYLIIVVDEFADLKKNEQEFMNGLIEVAQKGRSLGVVLILATQRPGGVVDEQIEANTQFQLCLRVKDTAESREMLKTPDAASITRAGRAYIKVRNFEIYELFQSYWSGASYSPDGIQKDNVNRVRIVKTNGMRLKTVEEEKTKMHSEESELTATVQYIADTAKKLGIRKLQGPLLPELPEKIALSEMKERMAFDGEYWTENPNWLSFPIGMFDIPEKQQQGIQHLILEEMGNTGIYGAVTTGKTTLLKTILLSVGLNYSPADVQIYGIDCQSHSTTIFSSMPHVGGIAIGEETEKIQKLEKMFLEELELRKKRFLAHYVGSLRAYRETVAADIPAWILVIDSITALFNLYPDLETSMNTLFREGTAYGIYIIFTANNQSGVKYKIQQMVKNAIVFEMTDKGEYSNLVGSVGGRSLGKCKGRAFIKENPPVIFQAAMYAGGNSEKEQNENLAVLLKQMQEKWTGIRPRQIPIMPETVSIEELKKRYTCRNKIPLGIAYEDISMRYADLSEQYALLVSGTMHSGKSQYLKSMVELIVGQRPQDKVYVFDSETQDLKSCEGIVHRYGICTDQQDVDFMQNEIAGILNARLQERKREKEKQGNAFDEKNFAEKYDQICIFIDDIKKFFDSVTNEQLDKMERICRLAQGIGVLVFAAGRVTEINSLYLMEKLTRLLVGYQQGIVLGGSAMQCGFFQNDLNFSEKSVDLEEGDAYWFEHGKCRRIRIPKK